MRGEDHSAKSRASSNEVQAGRVHAESERRFHDLADLLPQVVFEMDATGRLTFVNRNAYTVFGYSEDDFARGVNAVQMLAPAERARGEENIKRVFSGELRKPDSYLAQRKDGETFPVMISSNPIERNGKIIGLRGIIVDLTEIKQIQDRLQRESERREKLEFIVVNSPAVAFLWRAAEGWPVEYVTENVRQFGYEPDDFLSGRISYVDVIHPDDREHVGDDVRKHTDSGDRDFSQVYRILTQDGQLRWIDDRTWIRRDPSGVVTHYQGIVIDITREHEAQEAFEQKTKDIEMVNHMAIGREMRIIELKREINALLEEQGRSPRYAG